MTQQKVVPRHPKMLTIGLSRVVTLASLGEYLYRPISSFGSQIIKMSGRGKGGKGLGKGDAKRHRKILRDNIQGIT